MFNKKNDEGSDQTGETPFVNMVSEGKLTLWQSSVVQGDLYAQSLIVEEGATFNGTCHMRDYSSRDEEADENTVNLSSDDDTVAA